MFKDGAGASYSGATNAFTSVPYGEVMVDPLTPGLGKVANPTGLYYEMFNFGADTGAGQSVFKAKSDNSVAGEMRDCGECHVGGGMMEYVIDSSKTTSGTYAPASRTSLRSYNFGGTVTAFNALIDIFNPISSSRRGNVIVQDYGQTGVLEMDCLFCHMDGYSWAARKEAVRKGEFDASRPAGAKLVTSIVNGTTVFYNSTSVSTNGSGQLVVNLGDKLSGQPQSANCASCHLSQYNVDWKKRGEQWRSGTDVHMGIGCMGCHERNDKLAPIVGTEGTINAKLGLCDPAKGGASAFDALWNKLDTVNFKQCADCHQPATTPAFSTYGAPTPASAHQAAGLAAQIAYDKAGNLVSHIDLIDCTACHIKKTFDGGAFVDGTGADAEGRVALHDEPQVARNMTNGVAFYWDNGKLYAANLLTSFFIRDVNGMDAANNGLDVNNDGRNAGMDALLQTHINDINIAKGLKAVTMEKNGDGSWVNEAEVGALFTALLGDGKGTATADITTPVQGGIKQLLGISDAADAKKFLPKISFLMVPFKSTHNIVAGVYARGRNHVDGTYGCDDCHGANKGFYNGTYPIMGNMSGAIGGNYNFRFKSDQVTAFTKVNGLVDATDSHPNVITKKGDRTVPIKLLTKFDNPYVAGAAAVPNQTLLNIDRSEVIYESTFQTRDTTWYDSTTPITGSAPTVCVDKDSPFYCADPLKNATPESSKKALATSTKGWLLKIEVRPTGDTDPAHITFRTAQLGKDNAVNMAEVLGALPASFTTNTDFTVTESGGALTFTAAAGKQIRISPQTDVGPFGLKGKLWIADPVVRPDAEAIAFATAHTDADTAVVNGKAQFKTRAAYVAYLNSITSNVINTARPVFAQISSVGGIGISAGAGNGATTSVDATINKTLGSSRVNVYVNTPVALAADLTGNVATNTYRWTVNDGDAVTNQSSGYTYAAERLLGTGATLANATFAKTGIYKVTLTATNKFGESVQDTQFISVTDAPAADAGAAVVITAATTGADAVLTIGAIPAGTYDTVKIAWGDGSWQTAGVLGTTIAHKYTPISKYLNPGKTAYNYTAQLYFYKTVPIDPSAGTANTSFATLAISKQVPVVVNLTSDLLTTLRVIKPRYNGAYSVKRDTDAVIVVTVTNKGPDANGNIQVAIPQTFPGLGLPAGVADLAHAITAPAGTSYNATSGIWTITSLPSNRSLSLPIKLHMPLTASGDVLYTVPGIYAAAPTIADLPVNAATLTVSLHPY